MSWFLGTVTSSYNNYVPGVPKITVSLWAELPFLWMDIVKSSHLGAEGWLIEFYYKWPIFCLELESNRGFWFYNWNGNYRLDWLLFDSLNVTISCLSILLISYLPSPKVWIFVVASVRTYLSLWINKIGIFVATLNIMMVSNLYVFKDVHTLWFQNILWWKWKHKIKLAYKLGAKFEILKIQGWIYL